MRRYSGYGLAAVGTNKTIINLITATTVRPKLYEFTIGSVATPGDVATSFIVGRFTALGTEASGFTPVAHDPADPASLCDFGVGHSAEPTYTANAHVYQISMNQRQAFRFTTIPEYGFVAPATASNGLGLYSLSSTGTPSTQACMLIVE